jgi:excisionase family DNA binding protein
MDTDPATGPQLDLLTLPEAAAYTNTSERFARRLVSERRIPIVKLGRHVRISRAALDEYIAANTRDAREAANPSR